jgi:hypothetical protein
VTYSEFFTNLDKIIKLSEKVKEGLFFYLDKLKTGSFEVNRWSSVISRYTVKTEVMNDNLIVKSIEEDNFNLQEQILNRIKEWFIGSSK